MKPIMKSPKNALNNLKRAVEDYPDIYVDLKIVYDYIDYLEMERFKSTTEIDDEKLSFEKLDDGTCVITLKGKNKFGVKYMRQTMITNNLIFNALKNKLTEKNEKKSRS